MSRSAPQDLAAAPTRILGGRLSASPGRTTAPTTFRLEGTKAKLVTGKHSVRAHFLEQLCSVGRSGGSRAARSLKSEVRMIYLPSYRGNDYAAQADGQSLHQLLENFAIGHAGVQSAEFSRQVTAGAELAQLLAASCPLLVAEAAKCSSLLAHTEIAPSDQRVIARASLG